MPRFIKTVTGEVVDVDRKAIGWVLPKAQPITDKDFEIEYLPLDREARVLWREIYPEPQSTYHLGGKL